MLAIEIDGISHNNEEAFAKDETRQKKLESLGVRFVRFSESEMKTDMLNVLRGLEGVIIEIIKSDSSIKLPKGFDISTLDS